MFVVGPVSAGSETFFHNCSVHCFLRLGKRILRNPEKASKMSSPENVIDVSDQWPETRTWPCHLIWVIILYTHLDRLSPEPFFGNILWRRHFTLFPDLLMFCALILTPLLPCTFHQYMFIGRLKNGIWYLRVLTVTKVFRLVCSSTVLIYKTNPCIRFSAVHSTYENVTMQFVHYCRQEILRGTCQHKSFQMDKFVCFPQGCLRCRRNKANYCGQFHIEEIGQFRAKSGKFMNTSTFFRPARSILFLLKLGHWQTF